jgi:opacity protein-like surface antigen
VDSVGDFTWHDSGLSHFLMMVNLVVEHPIGRVIPFAGAGVGGDYSYLTFGSDYYYYWDPDGWASDYVLAYQAFAGLRFRLSDNASLGVMYRYFATQEQKWDVDWWSGPGFIVGVDKIQVHCVSLVFSVKF